MPLPLPFWHPVADALQVGGYRGVRSNTNQPDAGRSHPAGTESLAGTQSVPDRGWRDACQPHRISMGHAKSMDAACDVSDQPYA